MQANLQYCLWGYLQFHISFLFYDPSLQPGSFPVMLPPRWRHHPNNPYLKKQQKEKIINCRPTPVTPHRHLAPPHRPSLVQRGAGWARRGGGQGVEGHLPQPRHPNCAPEVTDSPALYVYSNTCLVHRYMFMYVCMCVCVYVGIRATETRSGGWSLELPDLPLGKMHTGIHTIHVRTRISAYSHEGGAEVARRGAPRAGMFPAV